MKPYDLALVAAALLLLPAAAGASLITVDTTADAVANDGQCSLREAIQAANTNTAYMNCPAGSSSDAILLGAGDHVITLLGAGEDDNATGDFDVTQRVSITGLAANVVISRGAGSLDRVFDVHATTTRFELINVELRNGSVPTDDGGAIRATTATQVSINSSRLSGHRAQLGGAIALLQAAGALATQPWLHVVDTTFASNQADFGAAVAVSTTAAGAQLIFERTTFTGNRAVGSIVNPLGGGIYANWNGSLGLTPLQLTITDCDFLENTSDDPVTGGGGAIYAEDTNVAISGTQFQDNWSGSGGGGALLFAGSSQALAITSSTFVGNRINASAGSGGAILAQPLGTATIENSVFDNNRSRTSGGAIRAAGTLILRQSELTRNRCVTGSGNESGGAVAMASGLLRVERSVLRDNSCAVGGAMWANGDEVSIDRSTVQLNSASDGDGGGLYVAASSEVELTNSTFSANRASNGGGISLASGTTGVLFDNLTVVLNEANVGGGGDGGGLFAAAGVTPLVANSIFARNGDRSTSAASRHSDCSGTLQSGGHNLVGEDTGCTITGSSTGNLVGTQAAPVHPHLRPLETFAGMPVHRLLFTSPALDAGASGPATGYPQCTAADELNQSRPLDGDGDSTARCDIGAVDWALVPPAPVFLDNFESGNALLW